MMRLGPYELGPTDDPNQGIYTGDARELAKPIPDESVDIIFTSPPYNAKMKYEGWDDDMPGNEFWAFQGEWLEQAYRISRSAARLYAIIGDDMLWRFRPLAESVGWRFHQLLVWCKPNLSGTHGKITKDWNLLAEWGLLFHKGKRTPMQEGIGTTFNWIVATTPQRNFNGHQNKEHPAQMAFEVPCAWLSRTPGEVVYDPFAGVGTSLMAAKALGRHWLGFDIGPATADTARKRVRNTQPPLFVPEPEQLELGV